MEIKVCELENEKVLNQIELLYEESFPIEERKPFSLICEKQRKKQVEILSVLKEKQVVGEAILAFDKELVLLDYLAVHSDYRGKGYGTRILQFLQKRFQDKKFFLEIERTGTNAPNEEQRLRRKKFYLANGMQQQKGWVSVCDVQFELLNVHRQIEENEYKRLYRTVYGKEREDTIIWETDNS